MRVALAGIVFAALLLGAWWLWHAPDASLESSLAAVAETGGGEPKLRVEPKQSTGSRQVADPLEVRRATRPLEARREAPVPAEPGARVDRTFSQRQAAGETRAAGLPDRGDVREDSKKKKKEGHEGFKQMLDRLGEISRAQQTAADDPIDTSGADLDPDELASVDLDGDGAIAGWELVALDQLVVRTDYHPFKHDSDDAAYPIDFESYSRAWEFEVIDTNGDGWMGESEYYSFLYETLQDSYQLDSDGDRRLSRAESGLSEEQFRLVDRDRSGSLKVWEIRRAVGRGIWR